MVNYSGDGGIAVFGWPTSMEDHADRACGTAWLIQHPGGEAGRIRDVLNRPIRFRVGIHSGLVGLRRMDMQIGSRLDPVGGTVHIAAALAEASAARQHLRELKDRRAVPLGARAHAARRRQDPETDQCERFTAWSGAAARRRASATAARATTVPPLVGRQRERDSVRQALARQDRGCRAIAVIGEPGIGKSRLAAAAIQDAQQSSTACPDLPGAIHGAARHRTRPCARSSWRPLRSARPRRMTRSSSGLAAAGDRTSQGWPAGHRAAGQAQRRGCLGGSTDPDPDRPGARRGPDETDGGHFDADRDRGSASSRPRKHLLPAVDGRERRLRTLYAAGDGTTGVACRGSGHRRHGPAARSPAARRDARTRPPSVAAGRAAAVHRRQAPRQGGRRAVRARTDRAVDRRRPEREHQPGAAKRPVGDPRPPQPPFAERKGVRRRR